jgi:hypothetical protein
MGFTGLTGSPGPKGEPGESIRGEQGKLYYFQEEEYK